MSAISQASTTLPSRRWVITAWSIWKLRPVPSTPAKLAVIVPVTTTRTISTSPQTYHDLLSLVAKTGHGGETRAPYSAAPLALQTPVGRPATRRTGTEAIC